MAVLETFCRQYYQHLSATGRVTSLATLVLLRLRHHRSWPQWGKWKITSKRTRSNAFKPPVVASSATTNKEAEEKEKKGINKKYTQSIDRLRCIWCMLTMLSKFYCNVPCNDSIVVHNELMCAILCDCQFAVSVKRLLWCCYSRQSICLLFRPGIANPRWLACLDRQKVEWQVLNRRLLVTCSVEWLAMLAQS